MQTVMSAYCLVYSAFISPATHWEVPERSAELFARGVS